MADKERVEAATVLKDVEGTKVKPSFVQWAGLWLAAGVGSLMFIVTVGVGAFFYTHHPSVPSAETLSHMPDPKAAIEQYKELSGIALKSVQDLFQTIVAQALLPLFTAILGYIFAKGGREG
ncbi:MAG: hypothetical protein HY360_05035 [Verrucomicrobia bacterium]|nr:hypothetical protein [Verrucomicrobiota bacterium]